MTTAQRTILEAAQALAELLAVNVTMAQECAWVDDDVGCDAHLTNALTLSQSILAKLRELSTATP